ncbi:MAG: hypothetical protein ABI369_02060 [Acetobacteraceae bacterium]
MPEPTPGTSAGRIRIPPDHPCLPGHFPGRPIVPGVVLLDEAFALMLAHLPGRTLAAIGAVKFTSPVLPGHEVEVDYDLIEPDRLHYRCTVAGRAVLRGSARLTRIA